MAGSGGSHAIVSNRSDVDCIMDYPAHGLSDFLMDWFHFTLGSLVTFRLALMFSTESGPGRIFKKLRHSAPPKSATREGLSCLHCESVWWAAPVTVAFWWLELIPAWHSWAYWLGFSAVAIILHHAFTVDMAKK